MMSEVLTIVSTMIVFFRELMLYSLLDRYQHFGGTYNLHQSKKVICSLLKQNLDVPHLYIV
jgi:hypothetical protein